MSVTLIMDIHACHECPFVTTHVESVKYVKSRIMLRCTHNSLAYICAVGSDRDEIPAWCPLKKETNRLNASELRALESDPASIRAAADWRSLQQSAAEAADYDTTGDGERATYLYKLADDLEKTL